jgi:hypothetical protein
MFRPLGHHQKDTYHIQHGRKLLEYVEYDMYPSDDGLRAETC